MSDDPRLFDAFDDCLGRLTAGETLEDCLQRYPDRAGDLRPMLAAALEGIAASRVPHHVQMRSRARFLGAAAARRPETRRVGLLGGWLRHGLSTAITLAVGFFLGTAGLYYTSASTLPGDSLYGVKRAFESARFQLASDPGQRFTLEQSYEERRAAELQAVLAEDRAVTVSFGGVLVSRTETAWQIGGFNVQLTDQTEIVGEPQPGFYVAVVAENRNGALVAVQLEAEEIEIIGVLERSGRGWSIGGMSFVLAPGAVISGEVAPGVLAAARIRALHTGERVAVSLVTVSPTPPPTPTPTRTPSPNPTQTARPLPTRAPTLTPPASVAPTQRPPTLQAAVATASGDDNGNANDNQGEDNSGSGGGEDHSGSGGGGDNSGSGGGGDNSGSGGGGDNSGSGGGEDDSGSGSAEDNSGSGSGGEKSGSGGGDDSGSGSGGHGGSGDDD